MCRIFDDDDAALVCCFGGVISPFRAVLMTAPDQGPSVCEKRQSLTSRHLFPRVCFSGSEVMRKAAKHWFTRAGGKRVPSLCANFSRKPKQKQPFKLLNKPEFTVMFFNLPVKHQWNKPERWRETPDSHLLRLLHSASNLSWHRFSGLYLSAEDFCWALSLFLRQHPSSHSHLGAAFIRFYGFLKKDTVLQIQFEGSLPLGVLKFYVQSRLALRG